ncbi:MAG: NAD(P)/FAD-dependent oxidoreductase, partial [Eubacteriales bacterium]
LKRYTDKPNITHLQGNVSEILTDDGTVTGCLLSDGRHVDAPRIVVATGGKSYPLTGSTGAGYGFAKECGHTVMPLSGAIVPIELEQTDICKRLEGLSLRNTGVKLVRNGKEVYSDFGELVFTYYGVSGPTILSASAHCAVGDKLILDLKPALDEKTLDARLLSDFSVNINRNFSNSLGDLLPSKMIPVIIDISGIPAEEKVNSVTKTQRKALLSALKGLTFTVKGLRPIEEAVITAGGVNVRELDPKTMRSKITDGLWFAGEVIDVHAYTGGFNLQIAFSTAVAAASGVAQYFKEFM